MKKPIPAFKTDDEAEDFVANADLTEYDLSGGQIVRFEMRPKDKAVSLRLPEKLLDAIRGAADARACPTSASSACRSKAPSTAGRSHESLMR